MNKLHNLCVGDHEEMIRYLFHQVGENEADDSRFSPSSDETVTAHLIHLHK